MSRLGKVARGVVFRASRFVIPRGRRAIRHAKVGGVEMLVLANEDVGRQIALFGRFEAEEASYFAAVIRPGDVCFDIGGNVGFFSLLMARTAPQGQVHVFEPIPLNAALITVNVELNALSNVTVNNVAVSAEAGQADFSVSVDSAYSSLQGTGRRAEARSIRVPLVTIDGYIAEQAIERVDIMKVDVEGAEDLVVRGASALLSDKSRRPRVVMLELFESNLRSFGSDVSTVVRRMADHGYAAHVLIDGQRLVPFTDDMTRFQLARLTTFCNVFFTAE